MNIQSSVNSAVSSVARAKFAIEAFNTAKANEAAKRAERERKARQHQTYAARKRKAKLHAMREEALAKIGITKDSNPGMYKQAMSQLRSKK